MASSSSTIEAAAAPWVELPREITAAILQKLRPVEILTTAEKVCSVWRSVCRDPSMWRCIHMRMGERPFGVSMERLCRNAVDRSQGQLIDMSIEYFGSDYLLLHTALRSRSLRRLQLVYTYNISSQTMIEAVKFFPLLEELHLYYTYIDAEAIEVIGRSCPLLKSFKLNNRWYRKPHVECDLSARAIAKNMPELCHLQLFGNKMTNEGLQAIIEGCTHLESLDLRQCFNVHFGEDIDRLCSQRIKDLRRPRDPTDDYQFDAVIYEYESSDDDYMADVDMMFDYGDYMDYMVDVDMMFDYDDYMDFSGKRVSSSDDEDI